MKFVFFLFGIYLLALSCMPCSDSTETSAGTEVTVSPAGNHEEHSKEACTPFCVCSCCSVSVFYNQPVKITAAKPAIHSTTYFIQQDNNIRTTQNAIWQPPRAIA